MNRNVFGGKLESVKVDDGGMPIFRVGRMGKEEAVEVARRNDIDFDSYTSEQKNAMVEKIMSGGEFYLDSRDRGVGFLRMQNKQYFAPIEEIGGNSSYVMRQENPNEEIGIAIKNETADSLVLNTGKGWATPEAIVRGDMPGIDIVSENGESMLEIDGKLYPIELYNAIGR